MACRSIFVTRIGVRHCRRAFSLAMSTRWPRPQCVGKLLVPVFVSPDKCVVRAIGVRRIYATVSMSKNHYPYISVGKWLIFSGDPALYPLIVPEKRVVVLVTRIQCDPCPIRMLNSHQNPVDHIGIWTCRFGKAMGGDKVPGMISAAPQNVGIQEHVLGRHDEGLLSAISRLAGPCAMHVCDLERARPAYFLCSLTSPAAMKPSSSLGGGWRRAMSFPKGRG